MIEINANYFHAAAECQSTDEMHHSLNGVHISPHPVKGAVLTATDGRRLICLHDEKGICSTSRTVAIDPKALDARAISFLRRELADKSKVFEPPRILIDDDGIVTFGTYRSLRSRFIDGAFPDWLKVVRPILEKAKEGKYSPGSYNQKYVAAFFKIAAMLSRINGRDSEIRIISFAETEPSLIRFGGIDFAFGIIMPMQSKIANEIPAWMKPILEPAIPSDQPASPAPEKTVAA